MALAASGLLKEKIGGPSVFPKQQRMKTAIEVAQQVANAVVPAVLGLSMKEANGIFFAAALGAALLGAALAGRLAPVGAAAAPEASAPVGEKP